MNAPAATARASPENIALASSAGLTNLLVRMAAIRPAHDELGAGLRLAGPDNKNIENNPMQSNRWAATSHSGWLQA
jgi:hypothetical protein